MKNNLKNILEVKENSEKLVSLSGSFLKETETLEKFKALAIETAQKLNISSEKQLGSFIKALKTMAEYQLFPTAKGNFAYFIPYGESIDLQLSYQGLIYLANRDGVKVSCQSVYENDEFEVSLGNNEIIHKVNNFENRGGVKGYWAKAVFEDFVFIEIMSKEEVEKVRQKSAKSPNSPAWKDYFDEMAKKVVIKRLLKKIPFIGELSEKAISKDSEENFCFSEKNIVKIRKEEEFEKEDFEVPNESIGDWIEEEKNEEN